MVMKVFVFFMGYLGIMCVSCHSFLADYPKDQVYPTGIEDFNELLVGDGYASNKLKELDLWFQLMDDDVFLEVRDVPLEVNCHYWDISDADREACWLNFYKHIEVANVVLDGLNEFESSEEFYRRVRGEAYFLRGAYYYFLINLYAEPYSPKTASTALGVPLKLDPIINNRHYSRTSVEKVYQSIVSDLTQAVACLKGIERQSPYRANEMAARLLLSRVLLYMERWEDVLCHCDTILKSSFNQLLDYSNLPTLETNVTSGYSVETLFSSGSNSYGSIYWGAWSKDVSYFRVSDELLGLYDESDLRLVYFYQGKESPRKIKNLNDGVVSDYFALRVPEVYLNAAEAAVMSGKEATAIQLMQELRSKRLKSDKDHKITLTGHELLNFVRDERRRELAFEGHRWFDLRRYAVSSRWAMQKEINHVYYDGRLRGNVILKKYDEDAPYYVLLIPENEILINEGSLVQNKDRNRKEPIF